jgi:hypothetical protein
MNESISHELREHLAWARGLSASRPVFASTELGMDFIVRNGKRNFLALLGAMLISSCTLITRQADGVFEQHVVIGSTAATLAADRVSVSKETYFGVNINAESFRIGTGKKFQVSMGKATCAIVLVFDVLPALEPEWLTRLRAQKLSEICVINQRGEK